MKRRVLCSLALTLYLLAAATILSQWIEQEMITQVQLREVLFDKFSGKPVELPLSSVFQTGDGDHLYEVVEGSGWEQGARIQDAPGSNWWPKFEEGLISLTCDRDFRVVRSASRYPRVGEKVQILENIHLVNDRYLAVYSRAIPKPSDVLFGRLAYGMEPVAQSDRAMLLDIIRGNAPFLEHYVKGTSIITDSADRIFSLTDVESFLKQLPMLTALTALLIAPVELWAWSCCLLRRERRGMVALNAGLAAAAMVLAVVLIGRIDLPSSLMPTDHIFEFDYYAQELRTVAGALQELGNPAPDILAAMEDARQNSLRAALLGGLVPPAVIVLEILAARRKKKA